MRNKPLHIQSEYGKLESVIVCDPMNLLPPGKSLHALEDKYDAHYGSVESQFHPEADDWEVALFQEQAQLFYDELEKHGVELQKSTLVEDAWLQFFVRDQGFVIGDVFYLGTMRHHIRSIEQEGLLDLLGDFSNVVQLQVPHIEGGDIFVHNGKVFVGISRQTTIEAYEELDTHITKQGLECIPIECDESVLHLDCRFNIINKNEAILCPDGISERGVKTLREHFSVTEMSSENLYYLGTNYLFLSQDKVIVDQRAEEISKILSNKGLEVIRLSFTEPVKLWGSFRCATLPLVRH